MRGVMGMEVFIFLCKEHYDKFLKLKSSCLIADHGKLKPEDEFWHSSCAAEIVGEESPAEYFVLINVGD
jgi:hypothetical protein